MIKFPQIITEVLGTVLIIVDIIIVYNWIKVYLRYRKDPPDYCRDQWA